MILNFTTSFHCVPFKLPFQFFRCFLPLRKLTKDGKRIIVLKIFQGSTFNVTSELLVNFAQLEYDILMKVDSASKYIMIFDMENTTVQIMAVCFPVMKKLVDQITVIVLNYNLYSTQSLRYR